MKPNIEMSLGAQKFEQPNIKVMLEGTTFRRDVVHTVWGSATITPPNTEGGGVDFFIIIDVALRTSSYVSRLIKEIGHIRPEEKHTLTIAFFGTTSWGEILPITNLDGTKDTRKMLSRTIREFLSTPTGVVQPSSISIALEAFSVLEKKTQKFLPGQSPRLKARIFFCREDTTFIVPRTATDTTPYSVIWLEKSDRLVADSDLPYFKNIVNLSSQINAMIYYPLISVREACATCVRSVLDINMMNVEVAFVCPKGIRLVTLITPHMVTTLEVAKYYKINIPFLKRGATKTIIFKLSLSQHPPQVESSLLSISVKTKMPGRGYVPNPPSWSWNPDRNNERIWTETTTVPIFRPPMMTIADRPMYMDIHMNRFSAGESLQTIFNMLITKELTPSFLENTMASVVKTIENSKSRDRPLSSRLMKDLIDILNVGIKSVENVGLLISMINEHIYEDFLPYRTVKENIYIDLGGYIPTGDDSERASLDTRDISAFIDPSLLIKTRPGDKK